MDPTPLFTKTFDFVTWLMPVTNNFPRTQRFVLTQRLVDATLNFYELTLEANNPLPASPPVRAGHPHSTDLRGFPQPRRSGITQTQKRT